MLNKKAIEDIDVKSKKVLLRCDFNVPLENGFITDSTRISSSLSSIKKLLNMGAKLIICSHLGKPLGFDESLSLEPVAEELSRQLGKKVDFLKDKNVLSDFVKKRINQMEDSDIIMLENTRFREEEMKNSDSFSEELASLVDVYVNDAFGSSHRAHSSTAGVAKFVKESAIGDLMQKEIEFLSICLENPKRPFAAIIGGAKVSSKIHVIDSLLLKTDILIIGGGMAYTFLKALGFEVGKSLLEEDWIAYAKNMIEIAKARNVKLLLPVDTVVAKTFSNESDFKTVDSDKIPENEIGVDIGEKTIELYIQEISKAKTILWNGPMGVFEFDNFAKGTNAIAQTLANLDATTIIGGGDSVAAINKLNLAGKMSHISTGGGASLEFLEGKKLPGIDCIQNK